MTTPAHPSRLMIWALGIPAVIFAAFVVKDLVQTQAPPPASSPPANASSREVAVLAPSIPPTAETPTNATAPVAVAPQPASSVSPTTQAPPLSAEPQPAPTVSLRRYLEERGRLNLEGSTMARKANAPLSGSVHLATQLFRDQRDKAVTPDPGPERMPPSSTDGH